MTAVEPPFVAGTLAWCNEQRAIKGIEPLDQLPKGKKGDPLSCPCGKATGLAVGTGQYQSRASFEGAFVPEEGVKKLPSVVGDFVTAFDRGELPQYDEEAR